MTTDRRKSPRGVYLGILLTLIVHLVFVIYSFGRMTAAIENMDRRVGRIEMLIDQGFNTKKN